MASPSQESTASESSNTNKDLTGYKIDITTPSILTWENEHVSDLTLDLHFDPPSRTAFFKLRATVTLKSQRTNIFLFIAPERIKSLALDESPEPRSIPSDVANKLGSTYACLHFNLDVAADLVGPKFVDFIPKNKTVGHILDQLRSAARVSAFSIYISHKVLPKTQLLSLCRIVSQSDFKSIAGQADLKCLYHGKGGKVICGGSVPTPSNEMAFLPQPSDENPPSYDEAGPSPPPVSTADSSQSANKKRRRDSTGTAGQSTELLMAMEAMCRKMLQEQKAELRSSIIDEMKQYVSEEIQELETRINKQIEEQVERYAEKQEDHLADGLQEVRNDVDDKVEDEFYGLRLRLEDFVKEELQDVEERVIEHVRSTATVHLEFGV